MSKWHSFRFQFAPPARSLRIFVSDQVLNTRSISRVLYTECPFHFCIRLDPNFVLIQPQLVASEDLESDGDEDEEDKKQHKNRGNNSSIKAQWLVDDGISKKKRSGKDAEPLCCMTHAGHIQRTLQVGQMTQVIRDYIEEHSRVSVNVPSLQQLIEKKFNVWFEDSAIYYELDKIDRHPSITGASDKSACSSQTQGMLHWLREQRDKLAWAMLVENLDKSDGTHVTYETYRCDFGATVEDLVDATFEGCNVSNSNAKKKVDESTIHGRQYDKRRIIELKGQKMFFIAVAWVEKSELKMFGAYPEALVIDSKANTNSFKHAFFAGVGVDGAWRNAVLFRSWIPNNTADTYYWLLNIAMPSLIPRDVLRSIKMVMSDDCKTMGPIIEDVCGPGKLLPTAVVRICVYHLERNFFQDFGVGARRFLIKSSSTSKKKGGTVKWRYAWQRTCVGAIYRLQRCETEEEEIACKKWIDEYIRDCPDLGGKHAALRTKVNKFFTRKYAKGPKWILRHCKYNRILNIKASNRAEAEFSTIWTLRLTSATGMHRGITRIRSGASRRHKNKIHKAESWVNSSMKRSSSVIPNEAEWKHVSKLLTPHYTNKLEHECSLARDKVVCQYVEKVSETEYVFNVWRKDPEDDAGKDGVNDSSDDGYSSVSNESADEGDDDKVCSSSSNMDSDESDDADTAPKKKRQKKFEDGPQCIRPYSSDEEQGESIVVEDTNEPDDSHHSSFKWLHVRRVRACLVEGVYILTCDCGQIERCCIACRHALCVILEVCGTFNLNNQIFNRRMLLNYYYQCLCTMSVTVSTDKDMLLSISKSAMEDYVALHPNPTREGVPEPGAWAKERVDNEEESHNDGGGDEMPERARRVAKPSKKGCDVMHSAILENITDVDLAEYFAFLKERLSAKQRRVVVPLQGSHGKRNRSCGVADSLHLPKHAKKDASRGAKKLQVAKDKHDSSDHGQPVYQLGDDTMEKARETARVAALQRNIIMMGLQDGFFVEMFPGKGSETDRWFMQVLNGRSMGAHTDPVLQSAVWCKTNSVEVENPPRMGKCSIRSIKDSGSAEHFKKILSTKPTSASILRTAPPVLPLSTANIAISTWNETPFGWNSQSGCVAPGSIEYILRQKTKTVANVVYSDLRKAMTDAKVPRVQSAKNKEDLIKLMCQFKCEYSMKDGVFASQKPQESFQSQAVIARGPVQTPTAGTDYFFDRTQKSVMSVSLKDLRQAMQVKGLVGVDACRDKNDVIRLMVEKDFSYDVAVVISSDSDSDAPIGTKAIALAKQAQEDKKKLEQAQEFKKKLDLLMKLACAKAPLASVGAASAVLSAPAACSKRTREVSNIAAPTSTLQEQRIAPDSSSSDSDAPISKGAIRLAKASAAAITAGKTRAALAPAKIARK